MPRVRMRGPSPHSGAGRALLETTRRPLYDNLVYTNTTTGAVPLFQDPFGSGGKSKIDTNMEKAGALPTPRVFDIHKVELAVSLALANRSTALPGNEAIANQPPDFHNSLKGLLFTTFFELKVGTKNYIECPTFLLPSNNVVDGAIIGDAPVAGTFANGIRIGFGQSVGMEWSVTRRRIRLKPDEVFRAYLNFPIAGAGAAAGAGHVVYCFLHGLDYREVQ